MNRNPLRLFAGVVLFATHALAARADEWVLTFAVKEERIVKNPDGKTEPKTETRNYTQTVALGADYLAVEDDRQKSVFDLAGRRLRVANLADKTQSDQSLFSLSTGLEHELHNRGFLGAALRDTHNEDMAGLFDRFEYESELRINPPAKNPFNTPDPVIEKTIAADATEFRHAGRVVARFVPASQSLPLIWRHRFVNFLAYGCSLHPQIRRAIAETGAIPQELVFTWRAMNATMTRSLRLVSSAANHGNHADLPSGLKPVATDEALDAVLVPVVAAAASAGPLDATGTIQFANAAIEAKRPLDALLALLEYGLQTGEQVPDELRRHKDVFDRDPDCHAYLASFGQADKATAEKNLAANARISRHGLKKAHMLELQRANLLEAAGRPREAIDAFFAVLRANPRHAGALHDLGWIYVRNYEHGKAWQCWDPARRLYPGHPMLRDVIRFEMDTTRNQPDFF